MIISINNYDLGIHETWYLGFTNWVRAKAFMSWFGRRRFLRALKRVVFSNYKSLLFTVVAFIPVTALAFGLLSLFLDVSIQTAIFEIVSIMLSSIMLLYINNIIISEQQRNHILRIQHTYCQVLLGDFERHIHNLTYLITENNADKESYLSECHKLRELVSDARQASVERNFIDVDFYGEDKHVLKWINDTLDKIENGDTTGINEFGWIVNQLRNALLRPWRYQIDMERNAIAVIFLDRIGIRNDNRGPVALG